MGSSSSKKAITPSEKYALVIGISDYSLTLDAYKSLSNPA